MKVAPSLVGDCADKPSKLEWLALGAMLCASVAVVTRTLWGAQFGYDFSDESMYLQTIAHPGAYPTGVVEFGFVYHPLYALLNGDVVYLRQANILLTALGAWFLCYRVVRSPSGGAGIGGFELQGLFASSGAAASSLLLLDLWLPTPNYHSLALQGLLLAGIAATYVERPIREVPFSVSLLISLAGWLTFLAKPTSAAVLALLWLLFLFGTGRFTLRVVVTQFALTVLMALLTSVLIDGSPQAFIHRLAVGNQDAQALQGRYKFSEMMRWDTFRIYRREKFLLALDSCTVGALALACISKRRAARALGTVFVCALCASCFLLSSAKSPLRIPQPDYEGVQFFALPYASLIVLLAVTRGRVWRAVNRPALSLSLLFLVLPAAYVFGTNRNYCQAATEAAVFWVLAAIVLAGAGERRLAWRSALPLSAAAAVGTVIVLNQSIENPYRQTAPLREDSVPVVVGAGGGTITLTRDFAAYIQAVQKTATEAGFKPGDPVLDLTGRYPGTLFAMGGVAIGRPWMIGSYPGSTPLAERTLDRVPITTLRSAWILTEPGGPCSLPLDLLSRYHIDLVTDYDDVGMFNSPLGSYPDSYRQHLLRPKSSKTHR